MHAQRLQRLSLASLGLLLGCGQRPGEKTNSDAGEVPSASAATSSDPAPKSASGSATDGPQSYLQYEIRDAATGALIPGKLTLVGAAGTKTPELTTTDIPIEENHAIAAYSRVMSLTGDGRIALPRGTYDVYVSRGMEWSLDRHEGVVVGPKDAVVVAKLTHEIDTPGWISGDFHVHAASSFDSRVPMSARVYEFVSDGVDLIVSTDHNVIADYAPIIRELDAGRYLTSIRGDEVTTRDWGHFGAFPLPIDDSRKDGGAPPTKSRTAKQIFADVRKKEPGAIIDIHHPRFDRSMGYFSTGIFEPKSARAGRPGFSFDFDAVEVLNGYQDGDHLHVDQILRDWFSLISHGYLVTATGNSDTHHLNYNLGGYPRNYVRVDHADPSEAKSDEIVAAVRGHHAFFTTGPIVDVSVGSAGIGDIAKVDRGEVDVHVVVRAASWIATDRLTLYVDGKVATTVPLSAKRDAVRLDDHIKVKVEHDAFVVARVDATEPLPFVVGDVDKHFQALPLAITNPVFLDVDGDGRFGPPKKP